MRGPTLIKHLLSCSSLSNLLVKMLFIVILEGEVRAIVFRLVKKYDEFLCSFQVTPE